MDGEHLIAYEQLGDTQLTLATVSTSEATFLADGEGLVSITRTLQGSVFVQFSDDSDRCEALRVDGVGDAAFLGRADRCEVTSSGAVLLVNEGSRDTDVTVRLPNRTQIDVEFDGVPRSFDSARVSPDGRLVAVGLADPDEFDHSDSSSSTSLEMSRWRRFGTQTLAITRSDWWR